MKTDFSELKAFVAVARSGGFRDAARATGQSASWLSSAVRRLEEQLSVRLFNRTTRSVVLTEAGTRLFERLSPALLEVEASLDVVNGFRNNPAGVLRLHVPVSAGRLILSKLIPRFLAAYPDIRLEIIAEDRFTDILAAGCDAGIRYDERLAQDMIAIPIGPPVQRFATAASTSYLNKAGRPQHPQELLEHSCIRSRFSSGSLTPWLFEHDGKVFSMNPEGPLIVQAGGIMDLAVDAAIAGCGVVHLFEEWLEPHFAAGKLEPILEPWWHSFAGPYLYYPGRRFVPTPLRAFIDFVKSDVPV